MRDTIDDRIIEALLGPELTRKLDDYISREMGGDPWTRLDAVTGMVATIIGQARTRFEKTDQRRSREAPPPSWQG